MAFKMRPKSHCLWHIAEEVRSSSLNPRVYSCWDDESFLGKLKYLARQCHGGTVEQRCLEHYILGVSSFLKGNL